MGNLAGFLTSFQVTGTGDPVMQFQARMRFIAFTAQFVQREYDPLAFGGPHAGGGRARRGGARRGDARLFQHAADAPTCRRSSATRRRCRSRT